MTHGPERHLENREGHDAHGHGLLAHDRLDPPENALALESSRWGEDHDDEAGEGERERSEPHHPVRPAKHAPRRGGAWRSIRPARAAVRRTWGGLAVVRAIDAILRGRGRFG